MRRSIKIKMSLLIVVGLVMLSTGFVSADRAAEITENRMNVTEEKNNELPIDKQEIIDGKTRELTYIKTQINHNAGTKENVYYDDDQNEYRFDDEGNLVGLFIMDESDHLQSNRSRSAVTTKEGRETIARQFLSQYVDLSVYDLVEETYVEATNYYDISFYKRINGYRSSDFVFVDMDANGNIFSFSTKNAGSLDNVSIPNFNLEEYREQIEQTVYEKYPSCIEYTIEDPVLCKTENGVGLDVSIIVSFLAGESQNDIYKAGFTLTIEK